MSTFSCAFSEDSQDCQLHRVGVFDTYADTYGRPEIQVQLNHRSEKFLVDTAGIYSAVQPVTVSDLHLVTRDTPVQVVYMANAVSPSREAFVRQLDIGDLPLSHRWLMVMPQGDFAADSQGMISGDILHNYDLELDPAAQKISFFLHDACGARKVHWTRAPYAEMPFEMDKTHDSSRFHTVVKGREWHISVPAQLNGQNVHMVIDTGAAFSFMLYEDVRKLLPPDALKNITRVSGPGAKRKMYKYSFDTLRFGGVVVRGQDVAILSGARSPWENLLEPEPELILGQDVLSKLHIYIAYAEHKIYFTAADAH